MKHSTYYKQVIEYCNNIISKKIQAGQYTIKACKRFLNDLKKTKDEGVLRICGSLIHSRYWRKVKIIILAIIYLC